MPNVISIRGARVHNLKNISLDLPRDRLVVLTGLSGSGKSSLAFDTIYAEGQRRYVESLSSYARQFLGLMDKPDVDSIDGLSPAISIDQKSTTHNPRSTVGTVTEIYDYLRLLYARIGVPHCPVCGDPVSKQSVQQISETVAALNTGTKVAILAPVVRDVKGEHRHTLEEVRKAGYARVRFDGIITTIEEAENLKIDKNRKHSMEVVVDRLAIGEEDASLEKDATTRLTESIEAATRLGDGLVIVHEMESKKDHLYSEHFACAKDGTNLAAIEPRNFSFNNPHGACPECTGLGTKLEVDADLVMPNPRLTLAEGAIRPWARTSANQVWYLRLLTAVAKANGFSVDQPVKDLSKKALQVVLRGTGDRTYDINGGRGSSFLATYEGVIANLMRRYRETESDYMRAEIERYMRTFPCPTCHGRRLKDEVLGVTVAGKNIAEATAITIEDARGFFTDLFTAAGKPGVPTKRNGKGAAGEPITLTARDATIARQILKEIVARLEFLHNVGLDYLSLDRGASTLAGGEAQRIRLATQIGSSLVGVVYILDEPSIGLHARDNDKLLSTLKALRDLGNTVLVVEHDESTMRAADQLVDVGPGAGEHGGRIVAQGTPAEIAKHPDSLTGKYLSGRLSIDPPLAYRSGNGKVLTVKGARAFNLKDVDVTIPLGKFVCITGVSGSGKSTLMTDILAKALAQHFYDAKDLPADHDRIEGVEHLDKVIEIDQSPIGRTPRSNPATYTGVFTPIRDLYTQVPEAKIRGYGPGRFSFNVKGGRCETCEGDGVIRVEMHFLPDVYVECEECRGKRYNPQALEILFRGKSIADVLAMTVEAGAKFFEGVPAIHAKLAVLEEVGLGYIKLGQPATTLSGGEAQRVKLATELSRRATGRTLYILDEPTTGLHFDDIKRLLHVLHQLADKGNTVLIIEHELDVIKSADWIVDLGPEGGSGGGRVVAEGTPKEVAKAKGSYTGRYLKEVFERTPAVPPKVKVRTPRLAVKVAARRA